MLFFLQKLGQSWKVTSSVWAEIENVKKIADLRDFQFQVLRQRILLLHFLIYGPFVKKQCSDFWKIVY